MARVLSPAIALDHAATPPRRPGGRTGRSSAAPRIRQAPEVIMAILSQGWPGEQTAAQETCPNSLMVRWVQS